VQVTVIWILFFLRYASCVIQKRAVLANEKFGKNLLEAKYFRGFKKTIFLHTIEENVGMKQHLI